MTKSIGRNALALLFLLQLPRPSLLRAQSFSTEPLRQPTAWPNSRLDRDPDALLDWITRHRNEISGDARTEMREQIYAVVADRVRRRFASNGETGIPADSTLAFLLLEADREGVDGAAEIARRMGVNKPARTASADELDFHLALNGETFALSSDAGRWRIQFPWYFMLWSARRVSNAGELPFNVISLSTLTAANTQAPGGGSQATILIVSAETDSVATFAAHWLHTFGVSWRDTTAKAVPQAMKSYKAKDTSTPMRMELSVFKIPSGSLLVGYFGLDGTYQANRQHYLDLLGTLQVR